MNFKYKNILTLFKKLKLHSWIKLSKNYFKKDNSPFAHGKLVIKPDLTDLYFLYQLIIKTKRTTILEFGCGYSTLIMALALEHNKKKYMEQVKNLRRHDSFKIFSVDDTKKYIKISKDRIKNYDKNLKNFQIKYSRTRLINHNGTLAIKYDNLPKTSPDFIYIDGPSQLNLSHSKDFSFDISHPDLLPITCDVLLIEYYLIPGTIICIDGRGANAQYLKDNLKRKWKYKYFKNLDIHLFILKAPPLGKLNIKQIKFFKNSFFE